MATLQDVCDNVDTHHASWFLTVEKLCSDCGTVPSLPRRCSKQTHRSNMPADTPSEYYCWTITIPLLDHLLSQMKNRSGKHQKSALLGLAIVPSVLVSLSPEETNANICQLAEQYSEDLPSPQCLESELHCWRLKWQQQMTEHGEKSLPTTLANTLGQVSSLFPIIRAVVHLLATLPVTTCSVERSFSALRRIK